MSSHGGCAVALHSHHRKQLAMQSRGNHDLPPAREQRGDLVRERLRRQQSIGQEVFCLATRLHYCETRGLAGRAHAHYGFDKSAGS